MNNVQLKLQVIVYILEKKNAAVHLSFCIFFRESSYRYKSQHPISFFFTLSELNLLLGAARAGTNPGAAGL